MEEHRDKWVQKTLESLEGLKPEGPAHGFFERVNNRLNRNSRPEKLKTGWLLGAAACFALLIAFNLVSLQKISGNKLINTSTRTAEMADDYLFISTEYNY